MSKVNAFIADVTCELGWEYKDAYVVVFGDDEMLRRQRTTTDGTADYTHKSEIASLEYSASFWQSKEAQLSGKKPRPLINIGATDNNRVFSVDLTHEESRRIIAGDMGDNELTDSLTAHDIKRKFG